MSGEVWYRGEAVGVSQAFGRTNPHDFADGMYLSDVQNVARQYAQLRSSDARAQRVWATTFKFEGLRVLDLTKDPRWTKYMASIPGGGENHIRQANENYGRFFDAFVKAEGIDLRNVDLVIGKEYVRGGRQLCVLNKNGSVSALATRVRGTFRAAAEPSSRWPSVIARNRLSAGRISSSLKVVGGSAAMIGLSFLAGYLTAKVNERFLEQELRKIEQTLAESLKREAENIARRLADGETAYAVVQIEIAWPEMRKFGEQPIQIPPTVTFKSLTVGDKAIESNSTKRETVLFAFVEKQQVTYSFPVSLSDEAVELYRIYRLEVQWFDDQLVNSSMVDQDLVRLQEDRRELMALFQRALSQ